MDNPFGYIKHAWNLMNDSNSYNKYPQGNETSVNPTRPRLSRGNERTTITSVYNRMAMDVASIKIRHVQLDKAERFSEVVSSQLNNCLSVEANKDQTGRALIQDIVLSMFDEGVVAVVPVDTTINPEVSDSYDISSLRTARIVRWYPDFVKVWIYNDRTGHKEYVDVPKKSVAIIENPLYAIMNEPNSTMQRLVRKLSILDNIDEESGSGSLDLIIQLPYMVKSEARQRQAETRRKQLEEQLNGSRYGVGYIDGTEKVTQLNRSVENNLMKQIEYLTDLLYSQLGITQEVMAGTADENTMNNYYNRVIEPILSAITDEFTRKFLTKTARTQGRTIMFFRDPFKLVPVNTISEMADKFTRNEILSSNEIRQIIGIKPSKDPGADELRNKNLSQSKLAQEESMGLNKDQNENEEEDANNEET